jgi:RNA polymerase sigma-70 factor (ECF subfamily)
LVSPSLGVYHMTGKLHYRIDHSREERFMQLFLQHERRLRAFIVTLVPHWADAEDLLQETSAIIWRKFGDFEPGSDFLDWALRIAHFEVLKHRKRQRTNQLRFSDAAIDALANRLCNFAEDSDRRCEALQSCLGKLTARDRELVQLRYVPEATVKDVAKRVGRSPHAVYGALNRIHSMLLECIRRTMRNEGI